MGFCLNAQQTTACSSGDASRSGYTCMGELQSYKTPTCASLLFLTRASSHDSQPTQTEKTRLIAYGGFNMFALAAQVPLWRQTVCNILHLTMKTSCECLWNNEWPSDSSRICGYVQPTDLSGWSVTTPDKYTERHIKYYLLTSDLVCTILSAWAPDFNSTAVYSHQYWLDARLLGNT